jgi:membrane protein
MQKTRESEKQRTRPAMQPKRAQSRGKRPERPRDISRRGWRDVAAGTKAQIAEDNIGVVAAGVAFFAFLAIFPAIIALISIYGLVVDPQTVQQQLTQLSGVLPEQARGIIGRQLQQLTGATGGLGWGLVVSVLVALWSANKGTKALFTGVNIAYNGGGARGFIKQNALTLLFTLGGILVVLVSMALIAVLPPVLGAVGLPPAIEGAVRWLRWPVLAAVVLVSLSAVYHYAPDREGPQWRWVSWGAGIATVLWLIASWAFSFYVANFGSYNKTYGSLAGVVILLLWFMLSSFIILLGAEVNSEMESQAVPRRTDGSSSSGQQV